MPNNPKGNIDKLERILNAWKSIAPAKKFGGMTVEQFEEIVNQARENRARVSELEKQLKAALSRRQSDDVLARAQIQLVKSGVLGDQTEGENSALYEAMGYIRTDNKKSGLTRKRKKADEEG